MIMLLWIYLAIFAVVFGTSVLAFYMDKDDKTLTIVPVLIISLIVGALWPVSIPGIVVFEFNAIKKIIAQEKEQKKEKKE